MSFESKNSSWKRDSIEAQRQPEEGRDLPTYELVLGFNREDLEGKSVLDLGVGPEAKFARELAKAMVNADVVGVSPDLADERHMKRLVESNPTARVVAGLGQELPFEDESFDAVVMLHVVEHIYSKEDFKQIIREIVRVLKRGGLARIGPLVRQSYFNSYGLVHDADFISMFARMNVEVTEEEISEAYGKEKLYDGGGMGIGFAPMARLILKKK